MTFSPRRALLVAAAIAVLPACGPATHGDADVATPAAAAPTVDYLLDLGRQANEAYFQGNGEFFEGLLGDELVMQQGGSCLSKAQVVKMIGDVRCDVEDGWSLTEPRMSKIDDETYVLSYVASMEGSCTADGTTTKLPSPVRASTVWARNGGQWQAVFHGENLIIDPAAPPATGGSEEPTQGDTSRASAGATPAAPPADAITDSLMVSEHDIWDAWMKHDADRIAVLSTDDMSFVNIFGTYLPDKAAAIKEWTSEACDVKRFTLTNGVGTSISPTVGILTVTGSVEGTCGEQDISGQEIYATTVYVKDGDTWKWAFGFNSPS